MFQKPNKNLVTSLGLIFLSWITKNRFLKWILKRAGYALFMVWGLREEKGGKNNFRQTLGKLTRELAKRRR